MRDEASFVEFAEAARGRLRRTAYLLCGDWDLASDHVQEGLIRVYVAWPRLREDQLQRLAWLVLVPLALAQLALTGVWVVLTA